MKIVKCILGTVVLFTFYRWTEAVALRNSTEDREYLPVSERSDSANKDLDGESGAFRRVRRNADPCVNTGCKWPRSSDGNVYVPYVIGSYPLHARRALTSAMKVFSQRTCIRFKPRTNEFDYLDIQPLDRCSSSIGRQGGAQTVKLKYPKCFSSGGIEHELLHALGFRHEQARSDRDQHVRVNWDNIKDKKDKNFWMYDTVNLGTPYDFNSIMHYSRHAFSKNRKPTLQAVSDPGRTFGTAKKMSPNDIERVNRLYCSNH